MTELPSLSSAAPTGPGSEPIACAACGCVVGAEGAGSCQECGVSFAAQVSSPAPLGDRAAMGFAMMLGQSLATRVLSMAGQVVLAYLLMPQHFGLMAMAGTVSLLAGLVQQIGVREVLLARQDEFDRLAPAAFWIMTTTGAVAGVVMAALSPLAARMYGDPELTGLVLVLALSAPLGSMSVVHEADLQRHLRFKYLAALTALTAVMTTLTTVGLAALGFGAYSFFLPRVLVACVRLVALWRASGLRPGWRPRVREWPGLIGESSLVFLTAALGTATQAGDVVVLGLLLTAPEVGYYSFAMSLSLQPVMMISTNLSSVMLPTLSRLAGDPARQLGALVRTCGVLGAVMAPICLVQAAAAGPALRSVFRHKWDAAIGPLQALSVGMLFLGTYLPVASMLQAQRRFGMAAALQSINFVVFFATVPACGWRWGIAGVSWAVSAYLVSCSLMWTVVTLRVLGGSAALAVSLAARPLLPAGIATATGVAASLAVPEDWREADFVRACLIVVVTFALYPPLLRLTMAGTYHEIAGQLGRIISRVRR